MKKGIYLSAIDVCQDVLRLANKLGMAPDEIYAILNEWDGKGLILYSTDKKWFLSLAIRDKRNFPSCDK